MTRVEKVEASRANNLDIQSGLFFISRARKAFPKLRQAFVKTLILNHFNLERYIQIEMDVSGYTMGGILN